MISSAAEHTPLQWPRHAVLHLYPVMVRDFQSVIGEEILAQMRKEYGTEPDAAVACVGGGSNAIGTFYPLVGTRAKLFGIEAAGTGLGSGMHSASLTAGKTGILHGMMTYLLQDSQGQHWIHRTCIIIQVWINFDARDLLIC